MDMEFSLQTWERWIFIHQLLSLLVKSYLVQLIPLHYQAWAYLRMADHTLIGMSHGGGRKLKAESK